MNNEILEIKKENVIAAYKDGDAKEKVLLEKLFGRQHFITDVCERVKTLEDACREIGKDINDILYIPDAYERAEAAIKTFAEAMREGKPASECWYYPYFRRSSGGGSSFDGYVDVGDYSVVGARLRVDSPQKAEHMGRRMLEVYKIYINGL